MNTQGLRLLCLVSALTATGVARAENVTLGAIGDSISSGFNAQRLGDNRDLSWATGTKPESDSHLKKLTRKLGVAVAGRNEAVAGSKVDDLTDQVTRVLTYAPDYLTVTIGANDVCSWAPDYAAELQSFEAQLEAHLTRVIDARPAIRIYLAAIPNMHNLWEVAVTHSQCQRRWDLFGICEDLLGSDRTPADRAHFVEKWEAANASIAAVAARHSANVFHDPSMATTLFEWEHVSGTDCFHPSVLGQNLLSEKSWEGGWLQ